MSISALCTNTSEELMCALSRGGGGGVLDQSLFFPTCVISKTEAAASSLEDKENMQVVSGIQMLVQVKKKV